jgi:hypothetical protein
VKYDRDLHGAFGTLRKVGLEAAELSPVEKRSLLVEKPACQSLKQDARGDKPSGGCHGVEIR